jgi:hypothetical protein
MDGSTPLGAAAAFIVVVKLRSASPVTKTRRIRLEHLIGSPQASTDYRVKLADEGSLMKNFESSIQWMRKGINVPENSEHQTRVKDDCPPRRFG